LTNSRKLIEKNTAINDNYAKFGNNFNEGVRKFGCKRSTHKEGNDEFYAVFPEMRRGVARMQKNISLFFVKDEANQLPHQFGLGVF